MRNVAVWAFGAWMLGLATAFAAAGAAPSPAGKDINLAAFANGALIESASSEYGGGWIANWITDENPATGWATAKGARLPASIVISLPESSEIHTLAFDTASVEADDRGARDIDVLVSTTSAAAGFKPLMSVRLKPRADAQAFPVPKPYGPARFIKLVIRTSQGSADYAELMEFRAFGRQLTHTPLPSGLSGTYSATHYGVFHLLQNGAQLTGCYEFDGGLITGGLEAHLMRLTWTQTHSTGPAVMVLSRDGRTFKGWWADAGTPNDWHADWDLKKISDKVGSCPNWSPGAANSNIIAAELASAGRVRLYGINFDTDSDRIRPDAKPALDELLGALKSHPEWHVSIEGHTDSTGTAAHNMDLSLRRANAVKAALVAGGIAAGRLAAQGFGQTKPVASNDTDIGRAQNRRVEVVRQ